MDIFPKTAIPAATVNAVGVGNRIALNHWTLEPIRLLDFIGVAREAGYAAIELRTTDFTKSGEVAALVPAVRESRLAIASLGTDGTLVQPGAEVQRAWFATLETTVGIARAIGCGTIMTSTGMANPVGIDVVARLLSEAADVTRAAGLRLAFEFNAFHPTLNTLGQALQLMALADREDVGLALDSYHLCRSSSADMLLEIDGRRLFCVQLSDVPGVDLGQKAPLDRLTPGDGVVDWQALFRFLDVCGYEGVVSFEAPNPALWSEDPLAVARKGLRAIERLWRSSRRQPDGAGLAAESPPATGVGSA